MRDQLRVLGVDLLLRLAGLLAGGLIVAALWFAFPAYMDMREGRVTFDEVSNTIWLGVGAGIGFLLLLFVMVYLKVVRKRAQLVARNNLKAQVKRGSTQKTATRSRSVAVTDSDASWSYDSTGKTVYPPYWPELRQLVLDRDHNRCGNCGSSEHLHVHHIVPLSLGGSNEMGNLRTLCKPCHQRLHPHLR